MLIAASSSPFPLRTISLELYGFYGLHSRLGSEIIIDIALTYTRLSLYWIYVRTFMCLEWEDGGRGDQK
jgi:hypothetical protein